MESINIQIQQILEKVDRDLVLSLSFPLLGGRNPKKFRSQSVS